jgi:hypothetical protein
MNLNIFKNSYEKEFMNFKNSERSNISNRWHFASQSSKWVLSADQGYHKNSIIPEYFKYSVEGRWPVIEDVEWCILYSKGRFTRRASPTETEKMLFEFESDAEFYKLFLYFLKYPSMRYIFLVEHAFGLPILADIQKFQKWCELYCVGEYFISAQPGFIWFADIVDVIHFKFVWIIEPDEDNEI